ncbi:hypothetical protein T11_1225 [Trichinella zimbabwensis]|uniref:Uncharacterized protein n=1 Tax=Trichinella zimbabwensis TaxID=268475 RepID=A0A0V1GLY5_9BILA|nr:hypothetical protein T11_1225 [Trichinella zimbabwensis]
MNSPVSVMTNRALAADWRSFYVATFLFQMEQPLKVLKSAYQPAVEYEQADVSTNL